MDIYCIGDSITFGDYDDELGGWADRLKIACMQRFLKTGECDGVFNLGIGGETTRMMRVRLKAELDARFDASARSLVIFAYGANDAAESEGSLRVPLEEYVANLAWAIDEARGRGCEVRLLAVTPITKAVDGVRSATGRTRTNERIAKYNDALAALAQERSVPLLDVNAAFRARDVDSLFTADGLHPNAAGHAVIFELVEAHLRAT